MSGEEFVAVAVLTRPELEILGTGFRRAFPLRDLSDFTELLLKIDKVTKGQGAYARAQDGKGVW